jgi:hypothetical protein
MENHGHFLGTYFNKETVLKLASGAKAFSWIIGGFYFVQWIMQIGTFFLQIVRGFWAGMGFMDISQNTLSQFELPLRCLVYFIVLQGAAQVLLMLMDIEDNTRRAARAANGRNAL